MIVASSMRVLRSSALVRTACASQPALRSAFCATATRRETTSCERGGASAAERVRREPQAQSGLGRGLGRERAPHLRDEIPDAVRGQHERAALGRVGDHGEVGPRDDGLGRVRVADAPRHHEAAGEDALGPDARAPLVARLPDLGAAAQDALELGVAARADAVIGGDQLHAAVQAVQVGRRVAHVGDRDRLVADDNDRRRRAVVARRRADRLVDAREGADERSLEPRLALARELGVCTKNSLRKELRAAERCAGAAMPVEYCVHRHAPVGLELERGSNVGVLALDRRRERGHVRCRALGRGRLGLPCENPHATQRSATSAAWLAVRALWRSKARYIFFEKLWRPPSTSSHVALEADTPPAGSLCRRSPRFGP